MKEISTHFFESGKMQASLGSHPFLERTTVVQDEVITTPDASSELPPDRATIGARVVLIALNPPPEYLPQERELDWRNIIALIENYHDI